MSSSDSSAGSPLSQSWGSPHSPVQQVPIVARPKDKDLDSGNKPYIKILEEPQSNFRFRYSSEREFGTHGCLAGATRAQNKTYPTVELMNYPGQAYITCALYEKDCDEEHPHQLLQNDQQTISSIVVPEDGSFKVCFRGLGIVHTAKKDVPGLLLKKCLQLMPNGNRTELREQCKNKAKSINLNIVRLRFSAHDIDTHAEICSEYSWPIRNLKSVATNELKICKYNLLYGQARGGDNMFLLVEKVSKKNIEVIFYELDEHGDRIWSRAAHFTDMDVHHQYAIVCRTPPYRNTKISNDVNVFVELLRPTDGRVSERKPFTYKAEAIYRNCKRKFPSPSHCSPSSENSWRSEPGTPQTSQRSPEYEMRSPETCVVPQVHPPLYKMPRKSAVPIQAGIQISCQGGVPVSEVYLPPNFDVNIPQGATVHEYLVFPPNNTMQKTNQIVSQQQPMSTNYTDEVIDSFLTAPGTTQLQAGTIANSSNEANDNYMERYGELSYNEVPQEHNENELDLENCHITPLTQNDPMLSVTNAPIPGPILPAPNAQELADFQRGNYTEYLLEHGLEDTSFPFQLFNHYTFNPDSIAVDTKGNEAQKLNDPGNEDTDTLHSKWQRMTDDTQKSFIEVKKILNEIFQVLKCKKGFQSEVRKKLEALFDIRLSNGDTYLHVALFSKPTIMEFIVKLVHSMGNTHLLNVTNDQEQTILHMAVNSELSQLSGFLVSKGCDPMVGNNEGNNAFHLAVRCRDTLEALLDATIKASVPINLNAYNDDKQTALHLMVLYDSEASARLLLQRGADYNITDFEGRTPLHIAACDDRLTMVKVLLEFMKTCDVDAVDIRGYTALKMVCEGAVGENTAEIINLLLEKKADIQKCIQSAQEAYRIAKHKPAMWEIIKSYVPIDFTVWTDITDSEEEYESAEGEEDEVTSKLDNLKL